MSTEPSTKEYCLSVILLILYIALVMHTILFFLQSSIYTELKIKIFANISFPSLILQILSFLSFVAVWISLDLGPNKPSKKFKDKHKKIFQSVLGVVISLVIFSMTYPFSGSITSSNEATEKVIKEELKTIMQETKPLTDRYEFELFELKVKPANLENGMTVLQAVLSDKALQKIELLKNKQNYSSYSFFDFERIPIGGVINMATYSDPFGEENNKNILGYTKIEKPKLSGNNSIAFMTMLNGNTHDCFYFIQKTMNSKGSIKEYSSEYCIDPEDNEKQFVSQEIGYDEDISSIELMIKAKEGTDITINSNDSYLLENKNSFGSDVTKLRFYFSETELLFINQDKTLTEENNSITLNPGLFCLQGFHRGNPDEIYHISDFSSEVALGKCPDYKILKNHGGRYADRFGSGVYSSPS